MLITAPRLCVRRPSPTTVEFTVTTYPPDTIPLRLFFHFFFLCRAIAAAAIIHLLRAVALCHSPEKLKSYLVLPEALAGLDTNAVARGIASFAENASPSIVVALSLLALWLLSRRTHASESLLVMRGLGVQTCETAGSYLAGTATRFIPTEKIQDIFVNEAFRGLEVRYHLVVVVEGESEVVVVFPGLLPCRKIVEAVWRGARECLYEKKLEEKGNANGST